jgi:hypothetical protein
VIRYLFDFHGWYIGTGQGERSTDEAPPIDNTADTPGLARARWRGWGWRVEPMPAPAVEPSAYAWDALGWFAGTVAVGTANSTRTAPDTLSTTTTPGQPRSRWVAGAWVTVPYRVERFITRRSFRARFSQAERVRIDLASIDNPAATAEVRVLAAELRASQRDVSDSPYVDLDLMRTRQGVQSLEAAGLLDAAGRALAILDGPIQPDERWIP